MPYRSYREWKEPGFAAGSALPGLHSDMDDIRFWQGYVGFATDESWVGPGAPGGLGWVPVLPGAFRAEDAVETRDRGRRAFANIVPRTGEN